MQNKLPEQATLILVGEIGKEEQEQRLVPEKQNYVSWGYWTFHELHAVTHR